MSSSHGHSTARARSARTLRHAVLACLIFMSTLEIAFATSGTDPRLGLPPTNTDSNAPAVVSLGRRLFFDKRLSLDGTISCASCHIPDKAFSDGLVVARGIRGQLGTRNTPSLWNVAFASSVFWDGRRATLEEQAADPLLNSREHGLPNSGLLRAKVGRDASYQSDFRRAFGVAPEEIGLAQIVTALAAYERTLVAGGSAFDRYLYGGDPLALSAGAVRGLNLFRGRAQCATCHVIGEHYALLTDNLYHNVGIGLTQIRSHLAQLTSRIADQTPDAMDRLIGADAEVAALGRFVVTKQPRDIGSFRTPSLRNVALTAPYMHDGSAATLDDALDVELYYRGIELHAPLILTPAEKFDVLEFLHSLTSPAAVPTARQSGRRTASKIRSTAEPGLPLREFATQNGSRGHLARP